MTIQLKQLKNIQVKIPESHRIRSANDEVLKGGKLTQESRAAGGAKDHKASMNENTSSSNAPESVFDAKNRFSKMESRVALSAFGFIVFVLAAAWFSWDEQYAIVGDAEAAYNYGLVGGIMMLVILIYSLRKRLKIMRTAGDIRYWYYFHFILGVVGPVLIILHTSFQIRSINGGVALFGMLLVVFSGFIGRYIYTRATYGLRSQERDMQIVTSKLENGVLNSKFPAFQSVETKLKVFSSLYLSGPEGFGDVLKRIFVSGNQSRWLYFQLNSEITRVMSHLAKRERWNKVAFKQRLAADRRAMRLHLEIVVNIGKFQAYEKLAGRWRLLHVPLLYVLVLSGLAHVISVHMY